MGVGGFIKRILSPEIDQTADRLAAQVSALEDESPLAGQDDDAPHGRLFVTEEEILEDDVDTDTPSGHGNREEPETPEPASESEQSPEPEDDLLELESQPGSEQAPEPEPRT